MKHLKHTLTALLALLLVMTSLPAHMFADDSGMPAADTVTEESAAAEQEKTPAENKEPVPETVGEDESASADIPGPDAEQEPETPAETAEGEEKNVEARENSGQISGTPEFTPDKADYLSYDPLYIAKYADPGLVNTDSVDMDRYVNVAAAAKGVATYNIDKQRTFEADADNYIAAVNYEMPVYDVDSESSYYVAIPNVNKFNSSFRAYGLTVAYNNDNGEVIKGWKYEKGILYIPKSALEDPSNRKAVPKDAEIAIQLNYAVGDDMDFSKTIPVQILRGDEPENMSVRTDNIFDADGFTVETGVKNRKKDDISVFLNGQMIPINKEAWEYDRSSGKLSVMAMPGIVSNINIVFENRTTLEKVRDISTGFIGRMTDEAYAASTASMTALKNSAGQDVKLQFDVSSMFVGWRGHYKTAVKHKVARSAFAGCSEWENSVYYLYGGSTSLSGADMSSTTDKEKDAGLAPLWAIMSYAYGGDTGLATNTNNIQHNTLVTHYVTPSSTETHTMYEWLMKYRNKLEKSKEVWADAQGNGLAGANNFAAHWPVNITVKGSSTGLVTGGDGSAVSNPDFVFATDQLSNSDWYAASCSELDDAAASDADSDVYVTCLDLTNDYIVLAFARASSGNSQTMTAIYKFGINAAYVKIRKQPAASDTDYLSECPNNYDLAGAVYELYKDPSCSPESRARDLSGNEITLITKEDGTTDAAVVVPGTYYAKEVTASAGYELEKAGPSGYPGVTVGTHNTADNPAVIVSDEKPSYGIPGLDVFKIDPTGRYAWKKLCGAEYTIDYYDALSKEELGTSQPKRSWTFRTRKMERGNAQGSVYAGFDFSADEPLEGSSGFYTENGQRVIPCGWITIREKAAPSGLALNKEIHYGRVFQPQNGAPAVIEVEGADKNGNLTVEAVEKDEPQTVRIIVEKKNAATGTNRAQESEAGHSSTRLSRFSSLAGAEYEVYYDDNDLGEPELVGKIITDENGCGELTERTMGDERMIGDKLAVGSYIIKEVKAPPGFVTDAYVLRDGKQETRKNENTGIICSYDEEGKEVKKIVNGRFSDGSQSFRTRAESRDTYVFSYTAGSSDEPVRTYISKKDASTGEELPGARLQIISLNEEDKDTVVEEWVSGEKEHLVWELPSGKYLLREITAPYGYDTAEDAEFEIEEGVITNRVTMENKPVRIETNALSMASGTHHGDASHEEVITDTVKIRGLYAGRTYKVEGSLVDRSTGNILKSPEGNECIAEKEFTAEGDFAEIGIDFALDSSDFTAGSYAVGFEKLYRLNSSGGAGSADGEPSQAVSETELAKHEDISNPDQTTCYGGIIGTRAADSKGKTKNIISKRTAVIKDYVDYKGLSTREEYTLEAVLFDKTTGKLTGIKAGLSFTPETTDGTAVVTFRFDSRGLEGHTMVVFETLRLKGRFINEHKNPDDDAQTVYIKSRNAPQTGDRGILLAWITFTTLSGLLLLVLILKRHLSRGDIDL